jgi:predicted transcriptional regulator
MNSSRDELVREFSENFRIDRFSLLEKISNDRKWKQLIESKLNRSIVSYATHPILTYSNKDKCRIEFEAEEWRIGPSISVDSDFRNVGTVVRRANLTLDEALDRIQVRYDNEQISFSVSYLFTARLTLEPSAEPNCSESSNRSIIGQHIFTKQFEVASVEPRHLRCWMMDKLNDENSGVQMPINPSDHEIVYGSKVYAVWFVRMVRRLGRNLLRKFLEAEFMSPETFEIISGELDRLDSEYGFADPTEPLPVVIPFVEPKDEPFTEDSPTHIIPPATAVNMMEAFKVSKNDRQKLRMLADFFGANGSQALYLSELGDILGLSSKSAVSEFLKRMMKAALISVEKTADDRQVVTITDKGHDVLSAFG